MLELIIPLTPMIKSVVRFLVTFLCDLRLVVRVRFVFSGGVRHCRPLQQRRLRRAGGATDERLPAAGDRADGANHRQQRRALLARSESHRVGRRPGLCGPRPCQWFPAVQVRTCSWLLIMKFPLFYSAPWLHMPTFSGRLDGNIWCQHTNAFSNQFRKPSGWCEQFKK